MLAITLGRRARVFALVSVTTFTVFGLMLPVAGAQAATVRSCQGGGAGYTVAVPQGLAGNTGGDPYESYAANCTIGYHEKKPFPLSLIGVVLAFTAATLILLHWRDRLDLPGGGGPVGVSGGDA
jgi:hypothetical protein